MGLIAVLAGLLFKVGADQRATGGADRGRPPRRGPAAPLARRERRRLPGRRDRHPPTAVFLRKLAMFTATVDAGLSRLAYSPC
jgi:hypothetical protein